MTPEQERELTDTMALKLQELDWDKDDCILAVGRERKLLLMTALRDISSLALSVVRTSIKEHPEWFVRVCPDCNGDGEFPRLLSNDGGFGGGVISDNCQKCNSKGLVAL